MNWQDESNRVLALVQLRLDKIIRSESALKEYQGILKDHLTTFGRDLFKAGYKAGIKDKEGR